jgi:hypothetical protein
MDKEELRTHLRDFMMYIFKQSDIHMSIYETIDEFIELIDEDEIDDDAMDDMHNDDITGFTHIPMEEFNKILNDIAGVSEELMSKAKIKIIPDDPNNKEISNCFELLLNHYINERDRNLKIK